MPLITRAPTQACSCQKPRRAHRRNSEPQSRGQEGNASQPGQRLPGMQSAARSAPAAKGMYWPAKVRGPAALGLRAAPRSDLWCGQRADGAAGR